MKNTFVKVLSFVMALMMVVGTFGTLAAFAADCTHPNAVSEVVPATCDKYGYTKYHCPDCGEDYIRNPVPAKDSHNWIKKAAVPATCTDPAYTEGYVCADCNRDYNGTDSSMSAPKEVPNSILGHAPGSFEVKVAKTCTTNAFTAKRCLRCNELVNKVEEDGTAGHEYLYEIVTPATECISGKVIVTCSECDFSDEIIQPEDHSWVTMVTKAEATAEALEKGLVAGDTCDYTFKSGFYCEDCFITKDTVKLGAEAGHANDALNVIGDQYFGGKLLGVAGSETIGGVEYPVSPINSKIAALTNPATGAKFQVGDVTYVENTCTTNGWYLSYCSACEEYVIKVDAAPENGHVAGEFGEWSTTASGVSKTFPAGVKAEDIQKTAYHMYTFTQVKKCTVCQTVLDTKTAAAVAHNFANEENGHQGTIVHKVTCLQNGYTFHECKWCGFTETVNIQVCKGAHNFEGATYNKVENYNCLTNNVTVAKCQNPECDVDGDYTDNNKTVATDNGTIDNAAHDWRLDIVPGTCQAVSYYQEKCFNCGETRDNTTGKTLANAAKDPANHVADANDDTTFIQKTTEVKTRKWCTDAEITTFICKCGERVGLVTVAAGTHNIVEGGSFNGVLGTPCAVANCTAAGHIHKNYAAVTPNCKDGGQTVGKICTTCGYTEVAPQALGVNVNNHKGAQTTYAHVDATCKTGGYTPTYCPACTVFYNVPDKDSDGNVIGPVADNHELGDLVAEVAAYCVVPGVKAHKKCTLCDKLFILEGTDWVSVTADKLEIPAAAAAHTWSVGTSLTTYESMRSPRYETCDKDGFLEYRFCTVCQVKLVSGAVTTGWTPANVKVVQIQNADKTVVVDDPATEDVNEAYEAIRIPAHGANYTKIWSHLVLRDNDGKAIGATCQDGAWTNLPTTPVCVYCVLHADRTVTDKYVGTAASGNYWINAKNHKNADGTSALTVIRRVNLVKVNGEYVVEDCKKASYEYSECALCKETSLTDYKAAVSANGQHRYELITEGEHAGEYVATSIKTEPAKCYADGYKYVKCLDCQYKNPIETIAATGHFVLNGTVKTPISFECEDLATYQGMTCAGGCGKTVGATTVVHNPVYDEQKGNCVTDDYRIEYCADCTATFDSWYVKAPGHDKNVTNKFVVSDTSAATVYRCQVCGENYSVAKPAPSDVVITPAFSAATVVAGAEVKLTVKVSGKALTYSAATVKVDYNTALFEIVGAESAVEDAVVLASKNGAAIIIPNDANGEAQTADLAAEGTVLVTLTLKAKKFANAEYTLAANAVTVTLDETKYTGSVAAEKILVKGLGNVNGDAVYSIQDAAAIYEMIDGEYDANADINGDGEVNLADAAAVAKYAILGQSATLVDYFEMIGELDRIEEYANELYADGKLADQKEVRELVNDATTKLATLNQFNYDSIEAFVDSVLLTK